jgi:hypothetical protein
VKYTNEIVVNYVDNVPNSMVSDSLSPDDVTKFSKYSLLRYFIGIVIQFVPTIFFISSDSQGQYFKSLSLKHKLSRLSS